MKTSPLPHLTRSVALALLTAFLVAAAAACGSKTLPPGAEEPDKFLFDRGTKSLAEHKWLRAREYFRQIVDNYPQSPLRPEAKLGLGDSYLGEDSPEALVLAVNEYREFLALHPTNPRADYAQYKVGLAHFQQMLAADRDQTQTREAIVELEAFVERYPNSKLMPEVKQKLRQARDRLSESSYRVGLHYFRTRWYPGAIDRFREILKDDPEFTSRDAVYYHLAESLIHVNRKAEALPYYERLVKEFERSEYLAKAQQRIAELKVSTLQMGRRLRAGARDGVAV
jgi:outer membrane protein assembly factor BamD